MTDKISLRQYSTRAKFISSKQRKYGQLLSSSAFFTKSIIAPGTNFPFRSTCPKRSEESDQSGRTGTILYLPFSEVAPTASANNLTNRVLPVPDVPARITNGLDLRLRQKFSIKPCSQVKPFDAIQLLICTIVFLTGNSSSPPEVSKSSATSTLEILL